MTRTTKTTTRKPTPNANKVNVNANKVKVNANKVGINAARVAANAAKVRANSAKVAANAAKAKVTPKVTATKPLANNKVKMATAVPTAKFSEKVYPIYQTPTAKNRRENTLNFAADAANNKKPFKEQDIMYGTKAQADSSRASVYKMNLKNFSGTNLPVYPDKNNPYVPPGNTGAGPLVKRKFVTNNAQLRANKRLTGKTGDER